MEPGELPELPLSPAEPAAAPTLPTLPALPTLPTLGAPPAMPAPGRPAVTMPPLAPNPGAHWAAPSPAGAADQPLVPLAESPRRSGKGKWIGAAAAVALLGAGAGVFAATRGGDKVEAFSLQAAGRQAAASDEVQMTMTMSIGPMEIDAEMIFDDNSGMFQMTMSGEVLGPSATDELTVILDTQNAAAYMGTAAFGDKIPTDAEWVLMDLKELGMNTSQLDQIRSSNPLDIAPLFEEADDVVEVGLDEVNGEKVKHFEVTVDIADVLAAQPDLQEQLDRLGELGGDLTMPDEVTFDVYVNEGSQLRRIVFEMMIGPMNFAADMVVTAIGDSVPPIEVPSGDNLVTFDELMGG